MIPFNSPLERAQAYEITQLKRELREKGRTIVPVFQEAKTVELQAISPSINVMLLAADARAEVGEDGVHVKGKTIGGLHVGYYLSREEYFRPKVIQAFILEALMADVSMALSQQLMEGKIP